MNLWGILLSRDVVLCINHRLCMCTPLPVKKTEGSVTDVAELRWLPDDIISDASTNGFYVMGEERCVLSPSPWSTVNRAGVPNASSRWLKDSFHFQTPSCVPEGMVSWETQRSLPPVFSSSVPSRYRTWIGVLYSNYTKFHDTVQKPTLGLYSVREREEEIHSSSGWCVRSVFLIPSAESRPYWPKIFYNPSQLSCGACKPHPFRRISFVLPTTQEYCTLLSTSHGRGTLQNWRLVAECS